MGPNKQHWGCPGGSALGLSPEDVVSTQWKRLSRGGMLPSQKCGGIDVASLFPWGFEEAICPVGRARATQVLSVCVPGSLVKCRTHLSSDFFAVL